MTGPGLVVDFACLGLIVEIGKNVLESFFLDDDANLFNASEEIVKI